MKKTVLLAALAATLAAFTACKPDKGGVLTQGWPGYQSFPGGYGYMDTTRLQGALDSVNIPEIRQHAWALFAGIMQPANDSVAWPTWYTWPNSAAAMEIRQMFGANLGAAEGGGSQPMSLIAHNKLNTPIELDTLKIPYYPLPQDVVNAYKNKPGVLSGNFIIPGKHFMDNGDILIATESLSLDGYEWIQDNRLYDSSVVMNMYRNHVPDLNTPPTYIVTKHMYWPVLAGQLGVIPVWDEDYFPYFYPGYAGYEKWSRVVAVDPTNNTHATRTATVTYLNGVYNFDTTALLGPITYTNAVVHNISDFYYHQVTAADWAAFDDNDKAILNASSYWVYGRRFGVGDYLVTIAMHINTKELKSWTMQSAWWTDTPGQGKYSNNQPSLPNATGPWRHYDMVQAYGVPVVNNSLERGTNPYIELVSHPMNTNCNNCHIRAGYPSAGFMANGASYQNSGCKYLLEKLYPTTQCLTYYTRTDFQWIIADYTHAVPPASKK